MLFPSIGKYEPINTTFYHHSESFFEMLCLTLEKDPCRLTIQSPAINKFGKEVDPLSVYL